MASLAGMRPLDRFVLLAPARARLSPAATLHRWTISPRERFPRQIHFRLWPPARASLTASTLVTVINHILVSLQPPSVTLPPMGVQGFVPAVLGSTNQSVTWQIQGAGCGAGACGSIDSAGTYTAPRATPTPNNLQVVAISQADSSQVGFANITISGGPNILTLHPASLYAGAADGFTLLVTGSGFVPSNPGPGSTLRVAGTARFTTCDTANSCTVAVSSADVTQAGNVGIQIQNPDATTSNTVQLVLVSPNSSEEVISLTSSAPSATAKDITVVQPTRSHARVRSGSRRKRRRNI
jgi:hypothetical protein